MVGRGGGVGTALSSSLFFSRSPTSYRTSRGVGLLEDMSSFLCPGGGWVLRISSERDDRRIFWGLKFSISGVLGVGKF